MSSQTPYFLIMASIYLIYEFCNYLRYLFKLLPSFFEFVLFWNTVDPCLVKSQCTMNMVLMLFNWSLQKQNLNLIENTLEK